jgi:hypothetical protein
MRSVVSAPEFQNLIISADQRADLLAFNVAVAE